MLPARSFVPATMLARQVVLLTPPTSFHPAQLLSRQQSVLVSPLAATLMNLPASVAKKRLTPNVTRLDATLTKNRGWASVNFPTFQRSTCKPVLQIALLSFHTLTNAPSRKPLRLTSLQMPGGYGGHHPFRPSLNETNLPPMVKWNEPSRRAPTRTHMIKNYLQAATEIAQEAGKILVEELSRPLDLHYKGDEVDLVTQADKRSEKLIVERLTKY